MGYEPNTLTTAPLRSWNMGRCENQENEWENTKSQGNPVPIRSFPQRTPHRPRKEQSRDPFLSLSFSLPSSPFGRSRGLSLALSSLSLASLSFSLSLSLSLCSSAGSSSTRGSSKRSSSSRSSSSRSGGGGRRRQRQQQQPQQQQQQQHQLRGGSGPASLASVGTAGGVRGDCVGKA